MVKQLRIFDNYKTPADWKENVILNAGERREQIYVKRHSWITVLCSIVVLAGLATTFGLLRNKNIDTHGNAVNFIAEESGEHFRGTVCAIDLERSCIGVFLDDGVREAMEFVDEGYDILIYEETKFYGTNNEKISFGDIKLGDIIAVNYGDAQMINGDFKDADSSAAHCQMVQKIGESDIPIALLGNESFSGSIVDIDVDCFYVYDNTQGIEKVTFALEIENPMLSSQAGGSFNYARMLDEKNNIIETTDFKVGDTVIVNYLTVERDWVDNEDSCKMYEIVQRTDSLKDGEYLIDKLSNSTSGYTQGKITKMSDGVMTVVHEDYSTVEIWYNYPEGISVSNPTRFYDENNALVYGSDFKVGDTIRYMNIMDDLYSSSSYEGPSFVQRIDDAKTSETAFIAEQRKASFTATIIDIYDNNLHVYSQDTNIRQASVSVGDTNEVYDVNNQKLDYTSLKIGDTVIVGYDDYIKESYPCQLTGDVIQRIDSLSEGERIIDKLYPIGVVNVWVTDVAFDDDELNDYYVVMKYNNKEVKIHYDFVGAIFDENNKQIKFTDLEIGQMIWIELVDYANVNDDGIYSEFIQLSADEPIDVNAEETGKKQLEQNGVYEFTTGDGKITAKVEYKRDSANHTVFGSVTYVNNTDETIKMTSVPHNALGLFYLDEDIAFTTEGKMYDLKAGEEYRCYDFTEQYTQAVDYKVLLPSGFCYMTGNSQTSAGYNWKITFKCEDGIEELYETSEYELNIVGVVVKSELDALIIQLSDHQSAIPFGEKTKVLTTLGDEVEIENVRLGDRIVARYKTVDENYEDINADVIQIVR